MQRRTLVCFLLSLLALPACSKDPATPEYWAQQLDAAKRSSERVRVVDTLRSSGKLNKSFLPMLEAELAKEKNPEEKGALARALGDLKDPSAVPALSDALDLSASDGATSRMNSAIAQALGAIQDPRAVPALLKLLKSKDDYVRMDAIQALGALKATEAVPPSDGARPRRRELSASQPPVGGCPGRHWRRAGGAGAAQSPLQAAREPNLRQRGQLRALPNRKALGGRRC